MNRRNNLCKASECKSTHIRKNGKKKGKQNHICVQCGRQFINQYEPHRGQARE
ncbi:IS1/IS1595 family N-terminal zinc-binding domain-containing protein, partial [Microcoleus sp. B4-D4]|uniref:IS1/IS1595 family N-terminal zinc-binding domain-containing protein n=1 Tax=Microcoleus sp. B4-D4 TaxID=2818667 RepID=UPI003FA58AA2